MCSGLYPSFSCILFLRSLFVWIIKLNGRNFFFSLKSGSLELFFFHLLFKEKKERNTQSKRRDRPMSFEHQWFLHEQSSSRLLIKTKNQKPKTQKPKNKKSKKGWVCGFNSRLVCFLFENFLFHRLENSWRVKIWGERVFKERRVGFRGSALRSNCGSCY